ncbi:MAG: threonine synthase [Lachnospiraceae bacterium]|nr:threonine synthase [Lachnospiraceae bacterium]
MYYSSTRDSSIRLTASEAVLKGLSDDGGLFVPSEFPTLPVSLEELADMDYKETAFAVMKGYLDDYTEDELKACIDKAYDKKFDTEEIVPMAEADKAYYLELFHGPTIAFKDMALSILPHLLTTAVKKNRSDKEVVILTATSGDTGKAALAGFADVPGTRIIVFYPKDGVSNVQKLQMVTQKGNNTFVVGVDGNFDDCQSEVKAIFGDAELRKKMADAGFAFSSANSMNIGRLVPQIAYYVFAYGRLVKNGRIRPGDEINVCVPTGNFGNILAAFFAKRSGLPIKTFICASNDNKVLFDFFKSGVYDKNRQFILTDSPSMDILISSNLERLIYMSAGCDAQKNKMLMESLSKEGKYEITPDMKEFMDSFVGEYADWAESSGKIRSLYENTGYIIDTHTAVAAAAYDKYVKETGDKTVTVIASTASPFKFARSVLKAIDKKYEDGEDFELINILSEKANVDIPPAIEEIRDAKVIHDTVCKREGMRDYVLNNMGLR